MGVGVGLLVEYITWSGVGLMACAMMLVLAEQKASKRETSRGRALQREGRVRFVREGGEGISEGGPRVERESIAGGELQSWRAVKREERALPPAACLAWITEATCTRTYWYM